ncbi:ionic transporter y4hA [Xinfangfangia sp. D13-10-4-6]|uniref:calcium:proton antiporter n=1 Tax=Pseudogemmobacter hezensis TaxID=2737662 RepID=UPI00155767A4|nr:ionic transporter y4hA [Pseudogemmobacter hezensis]NPD16742.1 ionic transporter y4hA [Pseudogemmobacter hezensis]
MKFNPAWTWAVPAVSWVLVLCWLLTPGFALLPILLAIGLLGSVLSAVHHAEVISLRVGEPFGTLVLALSVTVIEVALIVSMMLNGGAGTMALPRDTLFAAIMIILNGIIGLSLLMGGRKNSEQRFNLEGTTDALCTISLITVLTMVLPNFTSGEAGVLSPVQMGFLAVAILLVFIGFIRFQTVLHRNYFLDVGDTEGDAGHGVPETREALFSLGLLIVSLVAVVASAKGLSPSLEAILGHMGAPAAMLGVLIAAIVLLPEFSASIRAARANRLQTSLNLALGSAIASIGLTVPVVVILALWMGWPLQWGLDGTAMVLLALTLFLVALSLRTGNTTRQPGVLHVVLFVAFIFFTLVP